MRTSAENMARQQHDEAACMTAPVARARVGSSHDGAQPLSDSKHV